MWQWTSALLLISSLWLYAQKSTAERYASIPPPANQIQYTDGDRAVAIAANYLFITNIWAGLQIVDIADVRTPRQVALMPTLDEAYQTAVDQNYAYLANHAAGVVVYDRRDMNNVREVARIRLPGNAYQVEAHYPNLWVAMGDSGFAIVDISDIAAPRILHTRTAPVWIQHVTLRGKLLFAAAKNDGLLIFDISDPLNCHQVGRYRTNFNTMMVQVEDDNIAYVADGPGGLLALEVSAPAKPRELARFNPGGFVGNLHKSGNYVYLANRKKGLQIVNIAIPRRPYLEGEYPTGAISYGVVKRDIYVFLAADSSALILRHNNAPVLDKIAPLQLRENELFQWQLSGREPDGDAFEYQAFNLPAGASFDAANGIFSWTPTYEQSGIYRDVVFRMVEKTESGLSASDTVTITVAHVNRPPDLPAPPDTIIAENTPLTFTLPPGSDPDREDQTRLRYRAEKLPEGASFDPDTRTFSWTPTYEQSGVYIVDFLLDDGAGGIDREPVSLTVTHVDRPPVLEPISSREIEEGQTLRFEVRGEDPDREDAQRVTLMMTNLPPGATFDAATRVFAWTPGFDQSGTYPDIRAIITSGNFSDTTTFTLVVEHVNRPPQLANLPDTTIREAQPLHIRIDGSDPDAEDAGKLVFSAENLPRDAQFDAATRTFTWTPSYAQSGTYEVLFRVSDPSGLLHTQSLRITVDHVNLPPEIAAVPPRVIRENEPVEIKLRAKDPDPEDAGKLTFRAGPLPAGAALDAADGTFRWTPTYEQSGQYPLVFSVSDGQLSDSTTVVLTVEHVNRPPLLADLPPQTVEENQPVTFRVTGSDPDAEDAGALTYSARDLPDGAAFDPANRIFRWTPTYEQAGEYAVRFVVIDPGELNDQKTVTIRVSNVNRPPLLEAIAPQSVDEASPLQVTLRATDPDAEDTRNLSFSIDNLPAGAQLNPATGELRWTPGYDQAGIYRLTARVRDPGGLAATQDLMITVTNVNRPPAFSQRVVLQKLSENQAWKTVLPPASDPDAEDAAKLSYAVRDLPPGATFDPATRELAWHPTYEQAGEYTIIYAVSDGKEEVTQTITLQVADVPEPADDTPPAPTPDQ